MSVEQINLAQLQVLLPSIDFIIRLLASSFFGGMGGAVVWFIYQRRKK